MQAHVRNDVKPSVGQVVALDRLECVDVSSISLLVGGCINLDWYECAFDTQRDSSFLV
jgi:hypothetical protein